MQDRYRTAATIPAMNARLRTLVLTLTTVVTLFALAVGPALATESGSGDGKVPLPSNAHDQVGLIVLGICGVFVVAGAINAVRQLRGSRPQADGRIRWR